MSAHAVEMINLSDGSRHGLFQNKEVFVYGLMCGFLNVLQIMKLTQIIYLLSITQRDTKCLLCLEKYKQHIINEYK